jgi:phage tail sheath gpL-like
MAIDANSYAAANAASVDNVQFTTEAQNVQRKILIIGSGAPAKALPEGTLLQVFSAEDAADKSGAGYMLHRMAYQAFVGSQGAVPVYLLPMDESGTGVAATHTILVGVTTVTAGTIALYVGGQRVADIAVAAGLTADQIGALIEAAINADSDLPVTAANVTGTVTLTSKSLGTWGNFISSSFDWAYGEAAAEPGGVTFTVSATAGGANDPDVEDALEFLGTGDLANSDNFTDCLCGLQSATAVDAISAYNGEGDTKTGCYADTVSRPMRFLNGDTTAGSAGLTAMLAYSNARKDDRTNGVIAAPGSPNVAMEIASLAMGIMARLNNNRAAESYVDQVLTGIIPGELSDMWTSSYASRDAAVKAGVSPTLYKSGNLVMQNVLTHYHPDSVPLASNGYRSQRNISIIQNMLYNLKATFATEKWQGVSIVEDVSAVANTTDRAKARSTGSVIDDLIALADGFAEKAWIYNSSYTKSKLAEAGSVTIRTGANGFDSTLKVLLSGEAGIFNNTIEFDTSLSVVL